MIDVWLFFSLFILVLVMITHTYINALVRQAQEEAGKREVMFVSTVPGPPNADVKSHESNFRRAELFNSRAKRAFVASLILFQAVFWTVSMRAYLAGPDSFL